MPVDTTRIIPTRRTQRQITEEELKDIELKRLRGELSCAECRRLKLRCDKKVPCGSCCRRGCESICPCGILSAGQGTRFILADTEQLHRKISEMSNRIRQLEDALAILQSTISDQRHPLLSDEMLKVKFGSEALDANTSSQNEDEATRQSIDALGTLTLGDSGEVKYFGRSAGSETLMMAEEEAVTPFDDDEEAEEEARASMTPELENLSNLFPFTSKNRPNYHSLEKLESFLPTHDRAWALCDSYLDHASLFFRPIKRDELLNVFLPGVYNTASARVRARAAADSSPGSGSDHDATPTTLNSTSPHALATLYFLFALGALLDLNLPPYNAEAEHYYDLGRAALSLRAVFGSPSIDSVQALGLMATYHSLASKKYSRDSAWCVMSFAAKLAQSIGLHRDPARWKMDPTTVQKRRNLFWEVFASDVSHSLALGRPPAIHLSYVDCEFPFDEEASLSNNGERQSGLWSMKHIFGRDIFYSVAEATLTAKSPSYNTVLNLDRKVREISFPANFKPYASKEDGEAEFYSSSLSLRGFYASQHRTVTMLYLHRSFFAQAMLDHPMNPLLSPFAPSFLTAYRCASVIIKASAHQFERCADMAMRVWFLLYHTFSAAVIVGTVVTRSPNSNVASSALLDLNLAVELFERTAVQSHRAKTALGVLHKLKEKATRAYSQFCSSSLPNPAPPGGGPTGTTFGIFSAQTTDDVEDELAIFGGHTRVLDKKPKIKHSPGSNSSDSPSSSRASGSLSPPATGGDLNATVGDVKPNVMMSDMPEVHPSLVEYLNSDAVRRAHVPPSPPQMNATVMAMSAIPQYSRADTPIPAASNDALDRKQMGEMYSNFMSYLASRSVSNGPPSSTSLASSPSQNSDYSASNKSSPGEWTPQIAHSGHNSFRSDNGNFGWSPPSAINSRHNSPAGSASPSGSASGLYPPSSAGSSPPSIQQSMMMSSSFSSPGFIGDITSSYPQYSAPIPNFGFENNVPQYVESTDSMVEMGLSTESGMDIGWLSFMQECGILDAGSRPINV